MASPVFKGQADISLMQRFRKEGYWGAGGGKNFHGWHAGSWDEFHGRTAPKKAPDEDARRKELKNMFNEAMNRTV